MKVNIPLLSDQVPQDWQLRLIDNPGFGDARHHVAQVASESVHTSSMYIYLLETSSIGGVLAARFFKDLSCKDQGIGFMHACKRKKGLHNKGSICYAIGDYEPTPTMKTNKLHAKNKGQTPWHIENLLAKFNLHASHCYQHQS